MFLLFFQTIARLLGIRARAAHGCPIRATAQVFSTIATLGRSTSVVLTGARTDLPIHAAASTTLVATATATTAVV